jgi:hypothetical protein
MEGRRNSEQWTLVLGACLFRELSPTLIAAGEGEEGAKAEHEPLPTVRRFPEHRRERKVVDKNSTTELMLAFLLGLEGACE